MKALLYVIGEISIGLICFYSIKLIAMASLELFIIMFTDFSFDCLLVLPVLIFLLISIVYRL